MQHTKKHFQVRHIFLSFTAPPHTQLAELVGWDGATPVSDAGERAPEPGVQ